MFRSKNRIIVHNTLSFTNIYLLRANVNMCQSEFKIEKCHYLIMQYII